MNPQIADLDEATEYFQSLIDVEKAYVAKLEIAIKGDNLAYFFRWNAIDMIGASYQAHEAARYLTFINGPVDPTIAKEDRFKVIVDNVTEIVEKMEGIDPARRSTSLASNLEEDYCASFYLKLHHKLKREF